MKATYYLRKLLNLLHMFGLLHLPNRYRHEWKASLHHWYWLGVHCTITVAMLSNVVSMILYSTRNLSEFLQRLFETVSFCGYYYETLLLNVNLTQYLSILDNLDRSFCTRNTKLLRMSKREEKILCVVCFIVMTNTFLSIFAEAVMLPLDEEDTELMKSIYSRKYGRKLPVNFYIPGVDLSEPWSYWVSSSLTVYLGALMVVLGTVCFGQFPLFAINMEAQTKILCGYIKMIGSVHRDTRGDSIVYTNIINDEYVMREWGGLHDFEDVNKILNFGEMKQEQEKSISYELSYTRQVFIFHQKLLYLRKMYTDMMHWTFFGRALTAMVMLALSVYQAFSPDLYSRKTFFKYCVELTAVMSGYFYFCYTSERWQHCNDRVRRSVEDSCWYRCCAPVQRNVIMMHVRTANTADFVQVFHVFRACYAYYVSSVKLAYSFFNFIKLGTYVKDGN